MDWELKILIFEFYREVVGGGDWSGVKYKFFFIIPSYPYDFWFGLETFILSALKSLGWWCTFCTLFGTYLYIAEGSYLVMQQVSYLIRVQNTVHIHSERARTIQNRIRVLLCKLKKFFLKIFYSLI